MCCLTDALSCCAVLACCRWACGVITRPAAGVLPWRQASSRTAPSASHRARTWPGRSAHSCSRRRGVRDHSAQLLQYCWQACLLCGCTHSCSSMSGVEVMHMPRAASARTRLDLAYCRRRFECAAAAADAWLRVAYQPVASAAGRLGRRPRRGSGVHGFLSREGMLPGVLIPDHVSKQYCGGHCCCCLTVLFCWIPVAQRCGPQLMLYWRPLDTGTVSQDRGFVHEHLFNCCTYSTLCGAPTALCMLLTCLLVQTASQSSDNGVSHF
jgi:hypothetical protein